MNLDEDKPIDVKVNIRINEKLIIIGLMGVSISILITAFLLYYVSSDFITTLLIVIFGTTLIFLCLYFPITSPRLFSIESKIIDIEEEELEEMQSVMKPW
jgi:hypothetical protein